MNYNKLKYFYEISKIKNLSHAAEKLYVSQSSLSKTIADLEGDFGKKLFYRTHRKLTLTPAGEELINQIKDFFDSENNIYQKVRSVSDDLEEKIAEIKIGYIATETGLYIPPFIKIFKKNHPKIDVTAKRLSKLILETSLKNNTIDLAYSIFKNEKLNSKINYNILFKSHLGVIVNKNHRLANQNQLSFNDLKSEQFIMLGHDNTFSEYNHIIDWCNSNGFYINIIEAFDHVETVLLHLQNTDYMSILSDQAPYRNFKNLICIPIENSLELNDGFMWKKTLYNEYITLFIEEYKTSTPF